MVYFDSRRRYAFREIILSAHSSHQPFQAIVQLYLLLLFDTTRTLAEGEKKTRKELTGATMRT